MKRITTVLLAAAMVAAVPQFVHAEEGIYKSRGSTSVNREDGKFIRHAAEGNAMEIGMATLALRRAQDPQVRAYAQKLISDHQQSDRELQPLAEARGIAWPVPVSKSDTRELDRAQQLSGADFDRMAINMWVKDHRNDIKDFEKEAKHARDPQVKQFAISSLPVLRDHLNRAENLASGGVIREPAGTFRSHLDRDRR